MKKLKTFRYYFFEYGWALNAIVSGLLLSVLIEKRLGADWEIFIAFAIHLLFALARPFALHKINISEQEDTDIIDHIINM